MNEKLLELQKVLLKEPVIQTHTSEALITTPSQVESDYLRHASTHMSLGDTKELERLILSKFKANKTFAGLTTGDFGLGKTSFLVYLWKSMSDKKIMAVPPFSWRSLDSIFTTVSGWIKYKLAQENTTALAAFEEIAEVYQEKNAEEEIEKLVNNGMSRSKATNYVSDAIASGTLILKRNVSELLQFLDEVSDFLKTVGYEGLIVCLDELQITVSELSPERTFLHLFEISNHTLNRQKSYGIMIGLPMNTFVQMREVKADALDRFGEQRLIVDLSRIYDETFAVSLWNRYVEYFDFKDIADEIIDSYALKGLGEITDSARKEIGNGPRSVISAFNAIIEHYTTEKKPYTLIRLVEDIMSNKILLGQRSKYVAKIKEVLKNADNRPEVVPFIYTVAGLPQGCKPEVLTYYNVLNEESNQLLKEWLGKEITQSKLVGYKLVILNETTTALDSFYERSIRYFNMSFSAKSEKMKEGALVAFNEIIIPELFREKDKLGWACTFEQETDRELEFMKADKGYFTNIGGTFDRTSMTYPNRLLQLISYYMEDGTPKVKKPADDRRYRFVGNWFFALQLNDEDKNELAQATKNQFSYQFKLNISRKLNDELLIISDIVEEDTLSVLFGLNFLHYLEHSTDIPPSELAEIEFNKQEIIDNIITTLFTEELKTIRNASFEVESHGKRLLQELFESMCKRRFPDYHALITTSQSRRRLTNYKNYLGNENVPVEVKRGSKPLAKDYKRMSIPDRKMSIFDRFGVSSLQPFESIMKEFPKMFELTSVGDLYVKPHPAELYCLEQLKESTYTIMVDNKPCQSLTVNKLAEQLLELGYFQDESQEFILIGAYRRLFHFDPRTNVIYFKPLTLEEWKMELTERLQKIQLLDDEIELQGLTAKNNLQLAEEKIESVSDEDSYQQLLLELIQLEKVSSGQMSVNVNQQLNIITDRLMKTTNELREITTKIEQVQMTDEVEKKLWFEQQDTLKAKLDECHETFKGISQNHAAILKTSANDFKANMNGHEKFAESMEQIQQLNKDIDEIVAARKNLKQQVEAWNKWEDYFLLRIELRDLLKVLADTGQTNLVSAIEEIDNEVASSWKEDAQLAAAPYITKLSDIRKHIYEELRKSRETFNEKKEAYQQFLVKGLLKQKLLTQFNEQQQFESYQSLEKEYLLVLSSQLEKWTKDVDVLEQRLTYLQQIMEKDVAEVEEIVFGISGDLFDVKALLDEAADLRKLKAFQSFNERINQAKDLVANAVQKEPLTEKEEVLLNSMNTNNLTLEELILNYEQNTESLNLEEVLNLMVGLFKKNHINIRVEKGGSK
ncbi:hypothetical protein FH508_0019700 [Lysinibacillus sp. CD3-6]|uniref:hypothetical protein n=1 Tax=Lysinibacillus sp. CD3-6 TaxID=2892541 RepID=UPI00116CE038|nr:hypothetical protein [Lysinibacillus sp. CD3-6]UED79600.1 hypothetical protein FH508_0019700 [Lysinibacillus sp. CD3-6]